MFLEKYETEEHYDDYFDDDYLVNERDYTGVSEEALDFSHALYSIIQSIVDSEQPLQEKFTSPKNADAHFDLHCYTDSCKSDRHTVYYDFTDVEGYKSRENFVDSQVKSTIGTPMYITNLVDLKQILKAFHKLFEGSQTLVFSTSCGFRNKGRVIVAFHSWATDCTTNYGQNTLDFVIQTPDGKTITMFPIDANMVENQINKQIDRIIPKIKLKLKINY